MERKRVPHCKELVDAYHLLWRIRKRQWWLVCASATLLKESGEGDARIRQMCQVQNRDLSWIQAMAVEKIDEHHLHADRLWKYLLDSYRVFRSIGPM